MSGLAVAMIAMHTSPLDQPGVGDAGGMNVYMRELALSLARRDVCVDIFTRATASSQDGIVPMAPHVRVQYIEAGPFEALNKHDLPGQMCAMSMGVMRAALAQNSHYDLIHSHYWLSGQVGWLVSASWGVPLVHSMHTMARVKNEHLATGDIPEPITRELGEEQLVREADALIANTAAEASDLQRLYQAAPARVHVVNPGVDTQLFSPGDKNTARQRLGLGAGKLVGFAGRIQALKGPDVLVRALARIPQHLRPRLVITGGSSGRPTALAELRALCHVLGVTADVTFMPPLAREQLADFFRAVDVMAVPSRSESFGLVAAEALSCGTPVVAAEVGGLRFVVSDGVNGVLVPGHDAHAWAGVLSQVLADDSYRGALVAGALAARGAFAWSRAAAETIDVYRQVLR